MEFCWHIFIVAQLLPFLKTLAQKRVYGGRPVQLGEYPMMAQLLLKENNVHLCGGAIIDRQRILTAGHCFPCRDIKICAAARQVMVGDIDLHGNEEQPDSRQVIPIESIIIHENFDPNGYDNDVALVKVKWSMKFSDNVKPAVLSRKRPNVGKGCSICGWGVSETAAHPTTLIAATVDILDSTVCQESLHYINLEQMVCAGDPKGMNTSCHRDTGGPLICKGYLAGIVSYGKLLCNAVSVYMDIAKFTPWIIEKSRMDEKSNKGCRSQNFRELQCLIVLFGSLLKLFLSA